MYNQTAQPYSHQRNYRFSAYSSGRRTQKNPTQRTRLFQLLICLVLFLAAFIGKGVFPTSLVQVRDDILSMISSDIDFRQAFSNIGNSLTAEGDVLDTLSDFCMTVFGPDEPTPDALAPDSDLNLASLLTAESQFLNRSMDPQTLSNHYFEQGSATPPLKLYPTRHANAEQPVIPEEAPAVVAAAGTVLLKSSYSGQSLPDKYTMDHLSLGALETTTPVLGYFNSSYGYRDHPINGEYQFHGGIDIGGQKGDTIKAFAAGTVEYVGEDASYGLYLQLDHGNGIKSFYAHCNSITVAKGQSVALGEKIAEVGSSGSATGPHLHLELKYNQIHLDPAYYIESLAVQ